MRAAKVAYWRVGDPCELTVLQDAKVYGGCVVHAIAEDGSTVDVSIPNGRLYRLRADSSFLRRRQP